LSAFPGSWRAPKAEALEIVFQQDATARLQALLAGRLDIALGLAPEDRDPIEAAGGKLMAVPIPSVTALLLLAAKPGSPFADVRIRQAINYAVDKERLTKTFFAGAIPPAGQPAARTVVGYDAAIAPYPRDVDRARKLLAEAGRPDGFAFTVEAVVGSSGSDGAIYQQIAADLAEVKIRMEIRNVPGLRFGQLFRGGTWDGDAFAFLYGAEPTFDSIRALKYYTCAWTPRMYCDPIADKLIAIAEAATTIAARDAAARAVNARFHDQAGASCGAFTWTTPASPLRICRADQRIAPKSGLPVFGKRDASSKERQLTRSLPSLTSASTFLSAPTRL
jgi:ABC-type transport system substrate-binding protein